ncbi:hypothetical protein AB0B13_21445 [Streptomyces sp. NPDC042898]|uniref:hypothetical protein n=1 Tax=Streptomyces sp. NPDC042898 TaxID=3154334 RepID=UPI00340C299E
MKRELLYGSRWMTRAQARMAVFAWIAQHNRKRRRAAASKDHPWPLRVILRGAARAVTPGIV